jgi:hypothetical protein
MRGAFEWFSGLNLVQKAAALLFASLVVFSLGYLLATTVLYLYLGFRGEADSPIEERSAPPGSASPGSSASATADAEMTAPDNHLNIAGARWEGEKAVVEGTWKGDISSVNCDLLEGGPGGSATDWWDRAVGPRMDWSARTFSQEFVEAKGREIGDPIDPQARYTVACWAQFSGGWSTGADAAVDGTPPG